MSGYAAEALATAGTLSSGIDLIEKPFSPREFLERVRSILDKVPDRRGARV